MQTELLEILSGEDLPIRSSKLPVCMQSIRCIYFTMSRSSQRPATTPSGSGSPTGRHTLKLSRNLCLRFPATLSQVLLVEWASLSARHNSSRRLGLRPSPVGVCVRAQVPRHVSRPRVAKRRSPRPTNGTSLEEDTDKRASLALNRRVRVVVHRDPVQFQDRPVGSGYQALPPACLSDGFQYATWVGQELERWVANGFV